MVELPMRSLVIRGFRCFADLTVEPLGRVNLITGANGAGKSALLEALELYAHGGDLNTALDHLVSRRELGDGVRSAAVPAGEADALAGTLRNIFLGRPAGPRARPVCVIGPPSAALTISWSLPDDRGSRRLESAWRVALDGHERSLQPIRDVLADRWPGYELDRSDLVNAIRLRSSGGTADELGALWDRISLTPAEAMVLDVARIVAPSIEDIGFRGPGGLYSARTPWARVSGLDEAVTLSSLGEGVGRALGLALAATGAAGGWLLVDEIDTGLHHSTFPGLWRAVFSLAERLNVQVFATTHSRDCVLGFEQVLREQADADGALVWLQREGDQHFPAIYDREHLGVVAEFGLEVR